MTEKEEKVFNIFETIAESYDAANRRISFGMQDKWKQQMVDAAFLHAEKCICNAGVYNADCMGTSGVNVSGDALQPEVYSSSEQPYSYKPFSPKALDVCCGTGDIALALAGKYDVTGIDFSPAMLAVAEKRRVERKPFEGGSKSAFKVGQKSAFKGASIMEPSDPGTVRFIQGSAMELPFEAGSFDLVCISFGLRNTADYKRVLEEMLRVLNPGGLVLVLDSFEPSRGFVYPFYKFYFKKIMPLLGGRKKEYGWLNKSTEEFLSPDELSGLMESVGLRNVSCRKFFFGTCCLLGGYAS